MSIFTRSKLLISIILLLMVTNISTIVTVWHKTDDNYMSYNTVTTDSMAQPNFQRGRYFIDELDLSSEQFRQFRQFRQQYFPVVHSLKAKMYNKRIELLAELSNERSDTAILNQISRDIGYMHTQMKVATNDYFINMKSVCSPVQREKLIDIFKTKLNHQNSMGMPQQGRGNRFMGRGRRAPVQE